MKQLLIFIICMAPLLSCEGTQDEFLDDAARLIQDKKEQNKPHDTFLRVENNSNFVMENFEIGFHKTDAVALNSIIPDSIYSYTGFHQISKLPFIRFTVNQDVYTREFKSSTSLLDAGNYVVKVDILSVHNQSFSYKIEAE